MATTTMVPDHVRKMLDKAKARKRREDLALGKYEVIIWALTHERREKREALGKAFWIDYVIHQAESVDGKTPTPVGSRLDFPIMLEGVGANPEMSWADLKTFLVELTGCEEDEVSEMYGELVDNVSEERKHSNTAQLARGMRLTVTTYARQTQSGKNAGKTRVYPRWHHVDQTPEEIEKFRKFLEENP